MLTNFVRSLFVFVLAASVFSSCQKDNFSNADNNQNQTNTSFFSLAGNSVNSGASDTTDIECFDFVYPITILLPGGSTEVINSMDALENLIDQWFEENPDSEEEPTFQFPVTVTLGDGTQQSISKEDALCDLYDTCDFDDEECFEIVYPVDLQFPDGQVQTFNSEEELDDALDAWEASADPNSEEYPDFVYPIEVVYEDGTRESVNSFEELEELEDWCYDDYDDYEECYQLIYPVSIQLPGGDVQIANSEEELCDILDTWEANADPNSEEYPDFVYPIEVELEDGSILSIANTQEFEELEDECYEDFDLEECFTVSYPVQIKMPDESVITGNSEDDLIDQIDNWYDQNPDEEEDPEIVFPINITLASDGSTVEVNDEATLEEILYGCFGDDLDFEFYATQGSSKSLVEMGDRQTSKRTKRK